MPCYILKSIKYVLILVISFSTMLHQMQAQEVENIARFHSSKEGIYFRDVKKFGDYRYGIFNGGGEFGKRDSMFCNENFIGFDTTDKITVTFVKMNDQHEVLFTGIFHNPNKSFDYLRRVFYHNGIVYFNFNCIGDLWFNGELIATRSATESAFGPVLVGVDEITNKVVFVKGMDQNRFSGPEAIAFYENKMYIGGTVYGFGTSPDGYDIVLPVVASGVKGGYLLVYDLTTGDIINSATWGLGGYKSIQDMKVNSKGEIFILTNTGFGGYHIGLDTVINTSSGINNSFIQKYDKEGNLVDFYAFGLHPGTNKTLHQEMSILPDDRIAVLGKTFGYIKTSENDSIRMQEPVGFDLSVFTVNLDMEWVDYYCYTPDNLSNNLWLSDLVSDNEGNIYFTFGFKTPDNFLSKNETLIPKGYYFFKYDSKGNVLKSKWVKIEVQGNMIMDLLKVDKLLVSHFEPAGEYNDFLGISQKYRQESYLFELNMDKLTSSIDDEVGENIEVTRIYPNPIGKDDILNISTQEDDEYKIYDVMGRIHGRGYSSGGKISLIDHQLRAGVYIMKFGRNSKDSVRFIVE